jgi:E3 ubiquitin-protein ligase MARCH6
MVSSCLILVKIGRLVLQLCLGSGSLHEIYTAALGIYVLWIATRVAVVLATWLPQGRLVVIQNILKWMLKAGKFLVAFIFLGIIIPLLLGLLFEMVFIIPLRVPLDQSPVYFLWQDWAMGVLHAKIVCAGILLGPNVRLKRAVEQVYHDGIHNLRLDFVLRRVAIPVITVLLLIICIPYIIAAGIIPAFGVSDSLQNFIYRRIYPYMFVLCICIGVIGIQFRQVGQLFHYIRNDKYLVGQQLVNYEPQVENTNS